MITSIRTAIARTAAIAVLSTTALIGFDAATGHAAPAGTIHSTAAYTVRYLDDWTPSASSDPASFALTTGDQNAFIVITVRPAMQLGSNPMPQVFATSLGQYGTEVTTPQYGSSIVRGVRVQWASGVVRYGSNAHVGILTIYLATYHHHTYLAALGVVDTGDDASSIGSQEYQEGQSILNTLRFR